MNQKNNPPALAPLEQPAGKYLKNSRELQALADSYADLTRWGEAITFYQAAIALDPQNSDLYNSLGIAYSEIKASNEAEQAYTQAIVLKRNHSMAYYNLAMLYEGQQKIFAAIQAYENYLNYTSDEEELYIVSERLRVLRQLKSSALKEVYPKAFFRLEEHEQKSLRVFMALSSTSNIFLFLIFPGNELNWFTVLGIAINLAILYFVAIPTKAPLWFFRFIITLFWFNIIFSILSILLAILGNTIVNLTGVSGLIQLGLALAYGKAIKQYRLFIGQFKQVATEQ